jgi:PAS domain S-box-containing protein
MVSSDSCPQNELENRLRFEQMISDVSARLINLPPEKLDGEIEHTLKIVLEFFQVDRCGLLHTQRGKDAWKVTHLASSDFAPPIPIGTELPRSIHPWAYDRLTNHGEMVVFSKVDDMPDEAQVDKQTWKDWGIRSNLVIPVFHGETVVHIIAINTVKEERVWPEEYIPRLRLLGEILANTLQFAQTRKQLEERLRFEGLISDLSAGFVNISSKKIEGEIKRWLRRITEFFDADRCTLGLFSEDGTQLRRAFEYHLKGVEPAPVSLSRDQLPWYISQLMLGKFVVMNRLEDLPAEAEAERRLCRAKSMRSFLSIPMVSGGNTLGSCVLVSVSEERAWPTDLIQRLRLIADVFAGALVRKRFEASLRESEEHMNLAASSAEAGLWVVYPDTGRLWATDKTREIFEFSPNEDLSFELFLERVHPEDRESAEATLARCLETRDLVQLAYRIVLSDGSIHWVESRGRSYPVFPEQPVRVMGVAVDITQRKTTENRIQQQMEEIQRLKDQLEQENVYLQKEIVTQHGREGIIAHSKKMKRVLGQAEQVAPTDASVLLLGETGTGKELLAHTIHKLSSRNKRTFITINCAALPPSLIESELFGREKGAYTGALTRMAGRFEIADGSTLLLDEVGELPLELQAKLLRVIEDGHFERLGSNQTRQVDVRIIAATNRDLSLEVATGRFRSDLFYRLSVFPITIPPLRERREDIAPLVWEFIKQNEKKLGKRIDRVPSRNMETLKHYAWPGNARELRNIIEHAMITSSGGILDVHPPERKSHDEPAATTTLEDLDRRHILGVLSRTGWRVTGKNGAAEILGLKRTTLQAKMKKLGIKRPTD